MTATGIARLLMIVVLLAGFTLVGWQLLSSAPSSKRERPPAPVPLVDIVNSQPASYPLILDASGPVVSAFELEIRPQVDGRILTLHPDFEPGGRITAGAPILRIEPDDYELAIQAAKAEIAKAQAAISLERGRRIVAREELQSLQGSLNVDAESRALALRKPQLRQVEAELAAARNRLQRAELDLARTEITLPFDVIVLQRSRVAGEVVAARELIGRVTRADEYWVELRTQPGVLGRLQPRRGDTPGSRVSVRAGDTIFTGEIVRIRADLAEGSRLAGVIAALPVLPNDSQRPLIGQYVAAEVDAGRMQDVIAVPRRAIRDNRRIWVVDADQRLQVREANVRWESGQTLLIAEESLVPGDRVVVSRIAGLVPGIQVRSRLIDPASGRVQKDPALADRE